MRCSGDVGIGATRCRLGITMNVRYTYCNPEQLRMGKSESGYPAVERVPRHAIRPAFGHEINTWMQELREGDRPNEGNGQGQEVPGLRTAPRCKCQVS